MSLRTTHHSAARKQVEDTTSIIELARLEVEEGADPRPSVSEAIAERARQFALGGVSDDDMLAVMAVVEGLDHALVLAALEGDSQDDDGTGPGETREGGESPSVAGSLFMEAPLEAKPPKPAPKRALSLGRPVGRLVRVRQSDGTIVTTGLGQLRAKRGG